VRYKMGDFEPRVVCNTCHTHTRSGRGWEILASVANEVRIFIASFKSVASTASKLQAF